MSDYFKMYEDGLDEPRMKYAISKMSEVVGVWQWVLSQCCRKKRSYFTLDEFTAHGGAQTLNIKVEAFNKAIKLLAEIEYITMINLTCTVVKWAERQSAYCQKKDRTPSAHDADNVPLDKIREDQIKSKKIKRKKYGQYAHVLLTDKQYLDILRDFGESKARSLIKLLDEGIELKGYKYKNFNLALRKWARTQGVSKRNKRDIHEDNLKNCLAVLEKASGMEGKNFKDKLIDQYGKKAADEAYKIIELRKHEYKNSST